MKPDTPDTDRTLNLPATTHKLESLPKLVFDCLVLAMVAFACYYFGHNIGKSPQTLLIKGKNQEIIERGRIIQDKKSLIAALNSQLEAWRTQKPTHTNVVESVPDPGSNGLPSPSDLDTPEPPSNDDWERLFRSLQEEASGNPRVDALIEAKLESELSSLHLKHNSKLKLWNELLTKQAATKLEASRVRSKITELGIMPIKDKMEKYTEEESREELETLNNRNASLMKDAADISANILDHDGILAESTNQIVSAKQVLGNFKASRLQFKTDQTALQNTIKEAQAKDLQKHSEALAQISSLNSEADSFRNKIKALSDGYSLHTTLSSNNWTTAVFEEAKKHARRIPSKSRSLLDESQRKEKELKEDQKKTGDKLKKLLTKRNFLDELFPEGGLAWEAKTKSIQEEIGELEGKRETLTTAQGKNSGDVTKLKATHSKAVKEQNDALAKIELNEKGLEGKTELNKKKLEELSSKLEGFLIEPLELGSSPSLIDAIESELSKTTNNLNNVETLINSSGEKLKVNTAKLMDLKRKKGELEESFFGDGSETEQRAATQKLNAILPQISGLEVKINAINILLKDKNKEKLKLDLLKDRLKDSMAFFNPEPFIPPRPTDEIVLVPQGENISQCAFIVRQVPPHEKKSLFGIKATEYGKFLKFHNEQVAQLQSTMQGVRVCNKLKAGSDATDPEKYDKRILKYLDNALIKSSQSLQILGVSKATLKATGLSGKLIVYGYSQSESGKVEVYVQRIGSEPNQISMKHGIGDLFSVSKKE